MFRISSIVTLLVNKEHGSGEHALNVSSGVIGQIVNHAPVASGGTRYVVDFGPLGQWNCTHDELRAERPEDDVSETPAHAPSEFEDISTRSDDDDDDDEFLDNDDEDEDEIPTRFGAIDPIPPEPAAHSLVSEEELPKKVLSFEEALKIKMKELEKGC